jgi:hypothetical protein
VHTIFCILHAYGGSKGEREGKRERIKFLAMANKSTLITNSLYVRWPMFEVVVTEAVVVTPIVT